jgi:hypothetical protein
MAQFIKLKSRPQNHFLRKKLNVVTFYHVQKNTPIERLAHFEASRTASKAIIKDYLENKSTLMQRCLDRSATKYKAKFIVKILIDALYFRKTIVEEAHAIKAIAEIIAKNILSNESELKDLFDPIKTNHELIESFSIQIYVPEIHIEYLQKKYEQIIKLFSPTKFLIPYHCATGAQIWVNSNNASFYLDFDDTALDLILNRVSKRVCGSPF